MRSLENVFQLKQNLILTHWKSMNFNRQDKHDLTLRVLEDEWQVTASSNLALTISMEAIGFVISNGYRSKSYCYKNIFALFFHNNSNYRFIKCDFNENHNNNCLYREVISTITVSIIYSKHLITNSPNFHSERKGTEMEWKCYMVNIEDCHLKTMNKKTVTKFDVNSEIKK